MNWNLEVIIFSIFLITNFVLGVYFSQGVSTIKEYAIGEKKFSTATIVATLVATWITGEFFFGDIVENYNNGMYMMWAGVIGSLLALLFIGIFFAPRLAEFLVNLSIAEAMGDLFGKNVRIISAISGIVAASGMVAVQFKIADIIFGYLGVSSNYGVIIAGLIITCYSSLGGIKSVTLTDVIQFITFGTIIPIIGFFILNSLNSLDEIQSILSTDKLFDLGEVFDFSQPKAFYYLILFIYISIPGFGPPIFQRIAMAKDVFQVRKSFIIAAITCTFITITICWISILIYVKQPALNDNDIVKYLVYNNNYPELKVFILISVMAMIMSTADSYINSTSVLIINDIFGPLNIKILDNRLTESRIASVLIGLFSISLAFRDGTLMQLIIGTNSFYMPIVTVPFIMALLGFRSTANSVLMGMFAGFLTVILWDYVFFKPFFDLDSLIPAMFANLIVLISSHYLLQQKGGWVGIKDRSALEFLQNQRAIKINKFVSDIKNFQLLKIFKVNTPKNEITYMYLGLFCIISIYVTMHTIPSNVKIIHQNLLNLIITSVLFSSTILMSYPIWPLKLRNSNVITILWNFMLFYSLIYSAFILVIISQFAQLQVMIFMINLIMISILVRWQWALFLIISGVCFTIFIAHSYKLLVVEPNKFISLEFQVIYLLLFLSSILLAFFKPKQEELEATKQKTRNLEKEVDYTQRELANITQGMDFLEKQLKQKEGSLKKKELYLRDQVKIRNSEISKLVDMKDEFLRNIMHESNTPMTGIISMCDVLYSCYDQLDNNQIKRTIKDIVNSGDRLKSYVNSIVDLSKLTSKKYNLTKEDVNLGKLAEERTILYKKIFPDEAKKQKFVFNIKDDFVVNCDKYYITQTIDNLISNAVTYGRGKPITISLKREEDGSTSFSIKDQGIGIPKLELISIFEKFSVSSKTKTPAGGRGVGLALCKSALEAHDGTISANSDEKGSIFTFTLPKKLN